MGKSSLVKAVHAEAVARDLPLVLVEISRDDLDSVGRLLALLGESDRRFLLFADDLSFSHDDAQYKSLKAVLDGGLAGRPPNVVLYATSNRRHLMPRDMIDNERATAIIPGEAVEEKVSLSDRFGLWLGFHPCGQDEFLAMIDGYCAAYGLAVDPEVLRAEAIEWQATRGARSGRVAWQFFTDLAGRHGLDPQDPMSFLLLDAQGAWTDTDAILRVLAGLDGVWRLTGVLRMVPRGWRDAAYRALARNRYNQRQTAKALGLTYDQLRHCLKKHSLSDKQAAG